jgi:hypothetical protein
MHHHAVLRLAREQLRWTHCFLNCFFNCVDEFYAEMFAIRVRKREGVVARRFGRASRIRFKQKRSKGIAHVGGLQGQTISTDRQSGKGGRLHLHAVLVDMHFHGFGTCFLIQAV